MRPLAIIAPRKCARVHCDTIFRPRKSDGLYCTRTCANYDTKERRKARKYSPQTQERILARYGPAIIPPQKAPVCHGQQLSFGSNPYTGVTVQYCAVCGEKPMQRWGAVTYPQRPEFEAELQERHESIQRPAQKKLGKASRSWQQNFQVIGRDKQREIEAA